MLHFSLNVLARSHIMIGRFLRSLYVGRITEYLWDEVSETMSIAMDIQKHNVGGGTWIQPGRVTFRR